MAFGGGQGVTNSKMWERCETAVLIETKFGTRMQIRLHVNGHSWLKNEPLETLRGIVEKGGLGVTY